MESFFSNKRALVTGAGRGIGKAVALKLAALGSHVVALSYSEENLRMLQNVAPSIQTVCVDLKNWDATREAVQSVLPIDLVVNNAGIFISESFLETTEQTINNVMDVNFKAVVNISQIVAKDLITRGLTGAIVNLSSVASKMAIRDHTSYCASKAALDSLTRTMALELGPHKIRVNSINPTVILTDMGKLGWSDPEKAGPLLKRIPLSQFGEVEDAVNAVLFLLSDQSKFISGTTLDLDGGLLAN